MRSGERRATRCRGRSPASPDQDPTRSERALEETRRSRDSDLLPWSLPSRTVAKSRVSAVSCNRRPATISAGRSVVSDETTTKEAESCDERRRRDHDVGGRLYRRGRTDGPGRGLDNGGEQCTTASEWSPVVATRGNQSQIGSARKPRNQAESVALRCNRLPQGFDGKEAIDAPSVLRRACFYACAPLAVTSIALAHSLAHEARKTCKRAAWRGPRSHAGPRGFRQRGPRGVASIRLRARR